MKVRFTGVAARSNIVLGVVIIVLGAVAGAAVFVVWPEALVAQQFAPREGALLRIVLAVLIAALAWALGTRLIVTGQLLLVFLDMRRRLARLDRRARRLERRSRPAPSPQTERLRRR